jgi:putative MATE family efflux protein
MEQNNPLKTFKVGRLLCKYALPCVLSLLISALYNVVDQLFIGNSEIGYLGNTATTLVFPLTILALGLSLLLGDGAAAFLSLGQGKKDTSEASKAIAGTITLGLLISLVMSLWFTLGLDPILTLIGANETTLPLAKSYGMIVMGGILFYVFTNILNSIIRSDGSPIFAMVAQGSGALSNIILDYVFIYVCHWGLEGAAYATIIGQALSAGLSVGYLFKSKTFKVKIKDLILGFPYLRKSLKLGISSFFIQISLVFVTIVSNVVLVQSGASSIYGSDIPVAVFGIAYKVFTIVVNIPIGIALGGLPIIAYNYAAQDYKRVKETYLLILISSSFIALIATLIFEISPLSIISLFGGESDIYNEFAVLCFRIYLSTIILTSFQRLSSIFFQSLGKPIQSTILSLTRDLVLLVPLTLILSHFYGIDGFLISAPIADGLSFILTSILVIKEIRALNTQSQTESLLNEKQVQSK